MTREAYIQQVKLILQKRRDGLRRSLSDELGRLGVDHTSGVCDSIDQAVDDEFQSLTSNLAEFECRELERVERALEQIRSGEYGKCEQCQRSIPMARLKVILYATSCVKCQEKREARSVNSCLPFSWQLGTNESDDQQQPNFHMN